MRMMAAHLFEQLHCAVNSMCSTLDYGACEHPPRRCCGVCEQRGVYCHRHHPVLAISYRRGHSIDTSCYCIRGPTGNPNHCRAFRCSWRRCHLIYQLANNNHSCIQWKFCLLLHHCIHDRRVPSVCTFYFCTSARHSRGPIDISNHC